MDLLLQSAKRLENQMRGAVMQQQLMKQGGWNKKPQKTAMKQPKRQTKKYGTRRKSARGQCFFNPVSCW